MSFGARIPWWVSFIVLPFDLDTNLIRSIDGKLLFASAGNDRQNLHATTRVLVCWEKAWFTPCANSGVMCVAGLAVDSPNRDAESNWRDKDVDVYGPWAVAAAPTPNHRPVAQAAASFTQPLRRPGDEGLTPSGQTAPRGAPQFSRQSRRPSQHRLLWG
jgi:hypothetical protein